MTMRKLTEFVWVSPQMTVTDLKFAARSGVLSIVNVRPDGESSTQTASQFLEEEASGLGMEYRHIPVTSGHITDDNIQQFLQTMSEMRKPMLVFCGTGTRATTLWALSQAPQVDADALIDAAGNAGYDIASLRPTLLAANAARNVSPLTGPDGHDLPLGHPRTRDVVIVGGGAAGLAVAASLRVRDQDLEITLIEPSEVHYYQPGWTMVGGGIFNNAATMRDEASLLPEDVRWIRSSVSGFDPAANAVVLEDGERVLYKTLIVAAGLKLDWDAVPGLRDTLGENGVTSNYQPGLAPYTWKLVKSLKKGIAVFTQPPMPIKCAGAPQKAMYLSCDHWLRTSCLSRIDVQFSTAGDTLFGIQEYLPALQRYVDKYGIAVKTRRDLIAIDGPGKTATFQTVHEDGMTSTEEQPFDMIHVCPPQTAPDFVAQSALANEAGWVDIDPDTLQHVRYENVYSLGDVCSAPNAKTAAAVRTQAPIVAENILRQIAHDPNRAIYSGYGSCPLTVERGKIVLAEFGYGGKIMPTLPFIDGTKPSRAAWFLKEKMLPFIYWNMMLKGREWLVKYETVVKRKRAL